MSTNATGQIVERLGHIGLHVNDLAAEVAFFHELLGLEVSDRDDELGIAFLSSHPDEEHHELVLVNGRATRAGTRLVQQVSFRCVSLAALREFHERLVRRAVPIDVTVTHGNALSVYFYDPEGNRLELYWPTGQPARQPFISPIDLTRGEDELLAEVSELVALYGESGYVASNAEDRSQKST